MEAAILDSGRATHISRKILSFLVPSPDPSIEAPDGSASPSPDPLGQVADNAWWMVDHALLDLMAAGGFHRVPRDDAPQAGTCFGAFPPAGPIPTLLGALAFIRGSEATALSIDRCFPSYFEDLMGG